MKVQEPHPGVPLVSDHCVIALRVAKQREAGKRPSMKNKFTCWKASAFDAYAMRHCMEGDCTEGSSAEKKWKT